MKNNVDEKLQSFKLCTAKCNSTSFYIKLSMLYSRLKSFLSYAANLQFAYQLKHLRRTDKALQCDQNEQHWKLLILPCHLLQSRHCHCQWLRLQLTFHSFIEKILQCPVTAVAVDVDLILNIKCMTQFHSGCESKRVLIFKWIVIVCVVERYACASNAIAASSSSMNYMFIWCFGDSPSL